MLSTSPVEPARPVVVTVIIPTRNRRALLEETVGSVSAQTLQDWQLIVVDDMSEDATWSWLSGLTDPRITAIRLEEHAERSAARNLGLERAAGEYVLFLDDDDLLPADALATHVDALRRSPEAIATIGSKTLFWENGARATRRVARHRTVRRGIWRDALFTWHDVAGQTLFRRTAVVEAGAWDESLRCYEDIQLWLRIGRLGPVVLLPEVTLLYRCHSAQWRPKDTAGLMAKIRAQALERLRSDPGAAAESALAERIVRAQMLFGRGSKAFEDARALRALLHFVRAVQTAPFLLGSPLARPLVLPAMAKCLVGGWGIRWGRWLRERRRSRQPQPGKGGRKVNTDGLWDRGAPGAGHGAGSGDA